MSEEVKMALLMFTVGLILITIGIIQDERKDN
jgi:hypothetical protein